MRRLRATASLAILLGLSASGQILDASFSGDGKITTDLGSAGGSGNAMLAAPGGGFFVAGESLDYAGGRFVLLKYMENGTLDTSFGSEGVVLAAFDVGPGKATAMALQPDGRIILAGTVSTGNDDDFAAARFMPDGSLDASFAVGGQLVVPIGTQHDRASGVALLTDGRIVMGGTTHNDPDADFAMVALLPDGTLDPAFGSDGIKVISIGAGYDAATALAVQADGRIVQVGYSYVGNYPEIAAIRLLDDGTLDATFSDEGILRADIGPYHDKAYAIALQSDGKLVLAGSTYSVNEDFVVIRCNTDGSLDAGFGANGVVHVGPTTQTAQAVYIGNDGRIYLSGNTYWGLSLHTPVVCLLPNGALDPSFSGNGHVIISFALGADEGRAVLVRPDGRVVVAGRAANDLRSSGEISVFQLGNNGLLDAQFGDAGRVTTTAKERMDEARAVAIQPDGRILLAGRSNDEGIGQMALVRHSWQGQRDVFFGNEGRVRLDIGAGDASANAVAVRSDGRILVAGYVGNGSDSDIALVGLLANGQRDAGFGSNGVITIALGGGDEVAHAIRLDPTGRMLIVGSAFNGTDNDLIVVRFAEDGTLDQGFGSGGWTSMDIGGDEDGFAMALQGDGRIVLAGSTVNGSGSGVLVARLEEDGSPDLAFGNAGVSVLDAGADEVARAVVIDAQQRIVVAGRSFDGDDEDVLVARFDPEGQPDAGFGIGGMVLIGDANSDESASSVLVRPDGVVMICGSAGVDGNEDVLLVRIQANGELDPTFFQDGFVTVGIGDGADRALAVALQPDGKLVVCGRAEVNGTDDFAVIRFNYASIVMDAGGPMREPAGLLISPNPCTERASAVFQMRSKDRVSLQLVDGLGAVVRSFLSGAHRAPGRCTEELDLSGLSAGCYTLVLRGERHSMHAEMVKH